MSKRKPTTSRDHWSTVGIHPEASIPNRSAQGARAFYEKQEKENIMFL
jgi:hypothetical protein